MARAACESSAGFTQILPSFTSTFTLSLTGVLSSPFGPLMVIASAATLTVTLSGTATGSLPRRDIAYSLEDGAEHFAADMLLARGEIAHYAFAGRQDRNTEPVIVFRNGG